MKKVGVEPARPALNLPYLAEVFYEIGPTKHGGMGPAPLEDVDLQAWQRNTGIYLQPWEVQAVIQASKLWIAASAKAEDPDCPSPWDGYGSDSGAKVATARSMRADMRAMAKRR